MHFMMLKIEAHLKNERMKVSHCLYSKCVIYNLYGLSSFSIFNIMISVKIILC